jgi:hypothetical protein
VSHIVVVGRRLHVDVVELRKTGFTIIQSVRGERGTDEDPFAKSLGQPELARGGELRANLDIGIRGRLGLGEAHCATAQQAQSGYEKFGSMSHGSAPLVGRERMLTAMVKL